MPSNYHKCQIDQGHKMTLQTKDRALTAFIFDGLADVHLEPAHPASRKVVHHCPEPRADSPNNPVNNGGYYDCSNTHSKPKCSRTHTHAAPTHSRERPCHQRNTGHDYSDNQPYECIANCTKLQSGAWSNAFECSHRVPPSKLGAHATRSQQPHKGLFAMRLHSFWAIRRDSARS